MQPSNSQPLAAAAPAQQAPAGTADPPPTTDSIVLQPGSVDQLTGFDPSTAVLDLRQALAESHLTLGGDYDKLGAYVQVSGSGNDATLSFNPLGLRSTRRGSRRGRAARSPCCTGWGRGSRSPC